MYTYILRDVFWKVRNVGGLAERSDQIRGQIFKGKTTGILNENSNFNGPHFVECYIVKNNKVIVTDRISVQIAD